MLQNVTDQLLEKDANHFNPAREWGGGGEGMVRSMLQNVTGQ